MSQIFAAWFIAPGIAGAFAVIVFLITKYGVLERKDPLRKGLWMIPVYFGVTAAVLTMVIVWKGAASLDLDDWTAGQIVGTSQTLFMFRPTLLTNVCLQAVFSV